jgi:hypothetical protein
MVARIISGGQTGVDRGALDAALDLGIPCGGWCPRGRRAEDGPIPDHYPLEEMASADYPARTRKNVEDSDATLILTSGPATGGTLLTVTLCNRLRKPYLVIDLALEDLTAALSQVREWLTGFRDGVVNVAGPRETEAPGISERARVFIREVLRESGGRPSHGPAVG